MERQPIITENAVGVVLVKNPTTIQDLLPKYAYQFQNGEISPEASEMYGSYMEFLETNEELAIPKGQEPYEAGFQKAVALTRLWIESMYLK